MTLWMSKGVARALVSGLLGLTLVLGPAAGVLAQRSAASGASSKPITLQAHVGQAAGRHGQVNLATLPPASPAQLKASAAANSGASSRTPATSMTPAQMAAYSKYVAAHPNTLPQAVSAPAPQAGNLYGSGVLPVKQGGADGLNYSGFGSGIAPQPNLAVAQDGPYTVEGDDNSLAIYNSSFNLAYGPWTAQSLFSAVYQSNDWLSQPHIIYDAERSRIIISWLEEATNSQGTTTTYLDLAVSKSSSPTSITNYSIYQIDASSALPSGDYCVSDTLGYDYWGAYITCIQYALGATFDGNTTFSFSLDKMIAGAGLGYWYYWTDIPTNVSCGNNCYYPAAVVSPAIEDGVPQAEWLVADDLNLPVLSTTFKSLSFCAITNTQALYTNNTSNLPFMSCASGNLPISYQGPANAQQPGASSTTLDPGFGLNQISYRAGRLAFAITTELSCSGHAHDGILWADVVPQLTTLAAHNPQQAAGVYNNDTEAAYQCNAGADLYLPTLIASAENDLALVYHYSNATSAYPSIVYTGHANTDAPGTMGQGSVSKFVVMGSYALGYNGLSTYDTCSLAGSTYSRGIVTCAGVYGGVDAPNNGWDTYLYRLRME